MFKSLITSLIVSLVTFSSASAKMSLEEKEFKAINTFVAMQIYLAKTDQALFTFNGLEDFTLPKYTAQKISDDFSENNIAAEKQYGGKLLEITGKVISVSAIANNVDIYLLTANDQHGDMDISLMYEFKNIAGAYKKGNVVGFVCQGVKDDIIPTGVNCVPQELSLFVEDKQAEKITNSFLKGEVIDQYMKAKDGYKPAPGQLFFFKFAARYLPDNSPCLSWVLYDACDYRLILPNNGKLSGVKEYRDAYFQSQDFYHLP